jgi:uncharacterized protein YchJ
LVDKQVIFRDEIENAFIQGKRDTYRMSKYKLFDGTIKNMHWWDCFTESKIKLPTYIQKVGRNELCSCGSGKKFKKCCLNKELIAK